jgi:hypothetical protein
MHGPTSAALSSSRAEIEVEGGGDTTRSLPLRQRRRRLRNIVIGALSACALILVAAGIVRVSHARSEENYPAAAGKLASAPATSQLAALPAPAPPAVIAHPTSGTLRLDRKLVPRWVFLDDRKLRTRGDVVTCGPHQIKVGRGHPRPIDVPCGGELKISR